MANHAACKRMISPTRKEKMGNSIDDTAVFFQDKNGFIQDRLVNDKGQDRQSTETPKEYHDGKA
eukprot:CAMPEP_0116839278 /NCGR_PEP_ID=MMETSP0418-20121206/9679_1 /TAXON_ID=1158023 /ORGANISM="Astrosyne radiata, Strain 13vi08-1A" /LENGTH=63 /DNA_ID=CAMNT_0004469373 /DNA_START=250 /DNA_END=441 /DNA_ORIENTATION=+